MSSFRLWIQPALFIPDAKKQIFESCGHSGVIRVTRRTQWTRKQAVDARAHPGPQQPGTTRERAEPGQV